MIVGKTIKSGIPVTLKNGKYIIKKEDKYYTIDQKYVIFLSSKEIGTLGGVPVSQDNFGTYKIDKNKKHYLTPDERSDIIFNQSPSSLVRVMSNTTVVKSEKRNLLQRIIERIFNIFKRKEETDIDSTELDILKVQENNYRISSESMAKINKLKFYMDSFKTFPLLQDIYDYTKMFHDTVIQNNSKLQLIEQFHLYYTDHFIELFDKIIENNKMRISLIEKRKEKIKKDIVAIEKKSNAELSKIDRVNKIKDESLKYENMVIKQILNDFDQKIASDNTR